MAAGYRRLSKDILPQSSLHSKKSNSSNKSNRSHEQTPLLLEEQNSINSKKDDYQLLEDNENDDSDKLTRLEVFKSDMNEARIMIISSYINILLIFVPIGAASFYLEWHGTATFFLNFLAMIPMSSLLGDATECLADHLGEMLGGFINATFSNTVEVAVMVIALIESKNAPPELKETLLDVVQTSLIGSVFSNSLLVLGCCLLANGIKYKESSFNLVASSTNISLLLIAAFVLLLPSAYTASTDSPDILFVSRATAIILMIMYCCLLFFILYTHREEVSKVTPSANQLMVNGNTISSDIDKVNNNDDDNDKDIVLDDGNNDNDIELNGNTDDDENELNFSLWGSLVALSITSITITIESGYLVASIKPMADSIGLEAAFVGLILVPIVGNAVEHLTAIRMALKNKMDIALSITIGSATQVAMFVVALAVIVAWCVDVDLSLAYDPFEVNVFLYATIVVFVVIYNGKSNWLEGVMLLSLYTLIAVAVYHQDYCRGDVLTHCDEYKKITKISGATEET